MCEDAYQNGMWASYRPGKMVVSKITLDNDPSHHRGVPDEILAEVDIVIESLYEYLCACEALFRNVDASQKFQAIQKKAQTDPTWWKQE